MAPNMWRTGRGAHPTRRHTAATRVRGRAPHASSCACVCLLHVTCPFRARRRPQNPSVCFGPASLTPTPGVPRHRHTNLEQFACQPEHSKALCLPGRAGLGGAGRASPVLGERRSFRSRVPPHAHITIPPRPGRRPSGHAGQWGRRAWAHDSTRNETQGLSHAPST